MSATSQASAGPAPPLDIHFVGTGLQRPECVLTNAAGRIFMSDKRGGVMVIEPDGRQHLIGDNPGLVPNGIALQPDGSFLIANLGDEGGLWHLRRDGQARPWLMELDGVRLPRVNFVSTDAQGRTWFCVSASDGGDHYPIDSATGFIAMQDRAGTRVVAQGLRYTNEFRASPDGRHMYVVETFGRRLSRFRMAPNGMLSERATVAEFEAGDIPDGMALDAQGGAWVVCVVSNRVYRVDADGQRHTIIDDADPAVVERIEAAYQARQLTRPMLAAVSGRRLKNITSLAFGGPDLRSAWMGCLAGDALASFRSPVAGIVPDHWHWG